MAHYYKTRDLLGHFAKQKDGGKACPHPCCKGRRPHPDRLPVILDRRTLRTMSDEDLSRHVRWNNAKSVEQVMGELERRDRADQLKRERGERRRLQRSLMQEEHRLAVHAAYLDAESKTNGYMVNKAGRARGIDPKTLFTGPQSRVDKYASEELKNYFDRYGRPTATEFRQQNAGQREQYAYERAQRRERERNRQDRDAARASLQRAA